MKFSYLLVIAILAQGCLIKKVLVSNADYVVTSELQKRLHLTSSQKNLLSKDTNQFLNGIKPKLSTLAPTIRELKLETETIERDYTTLKDAYEYVTIDYLVLYSKYLAQLDSKQQKKFFETFDIATQKIKKQSEKEIQSKYEDRFEMFFGKITKSQKQWLKNLSHYHDEKSEERILNREKLKLEITKEFSNPIPDSNNFKSAMVNQYLKNIQHENHLRLLKELIPTLEKDQHEHFHKKAKEIDELIEIFIKKEILTSL